MYHGGKFRCDNNSTREKTAEQKAREAKSLKEIESVLAEKRRESTLKQNVTDVPVSAQRHTPQMKKVGQETSLPKK
ncbi:hypothetical protein CLNEO_13740 [Anaerotignum neopropionicum]|uniref:Uncharacterized protein n=1 Tax=Anaerotignum neopropionicum TaxID=36847 RepID=A0A136WG72_9FIRM|nr:hypothetical protein [Anaerotignum neopropionicum]KXL53403.1 hypothetical protein CLNEO_13740 [Anaerotignum neopropionicum]